MIKEFLHINKGRLVFLTVFFSLSFSILLLIGLLIASTEVRRPGYDVVLSALLYSFGAFILMLIALFFDGFTDFKKRRKLFNHQSWNDFFGKHFFKTIVVQKEGFKFKEEAKQAQIVDYNVIALAIPRDKAIQLSFLGKDYEKGKAKYDYQCNCNLAFTDLRLATEEIEETVLKFHNELQEAGILPSERNTHNIVLVK